MKYVANLLVSVHGLAAAEPHVLAMVAGMNPALVQKVTEDGPRMVADDYLAAARLDIILKDGKLIKDLGVSAGAQTPLPDAALPVYAAASETGLGDLDAAPLCRYLERLWGVTR